MTSSFGDELAAVLPELRAMAEARMTAACLIERAVGGRGEMDPETLQYAPLAKEVIYEGRCRVQDKSDRDPADVAGERGQRTAPRTLHLPIAGTDEVAVRDIVTITSSPDDVALVDRVFTIDGRHSKSQATARRLPIVEVTG